jgi:GGDEF domain-containing protein
VGGDEFGVLLADYGDVDAAAAAERIRVAVQHRCGVRGATVSIGGAGCESDRSATTLDADRALREAKSHGGNTVSVWASEADVSGDLPAPPRAS